MKALIILILYATIGSIAYVWSTYNETINPLISFGFFISFAILGGALFRKLSNRGVLI